MGASVAPHAMACSSLCPCGIGGSFPFVDLGCRSSARMVRLSKRESKPAVFGRLATRTCCELPTLLPLTALKRLVMLPWAPTSLRSRVTELLPLAPLTLNRSLKPGPSPAIEEGYPAPVIA